MSPKASTKASTEVSPKASTEVSPEVSTEVSTEVRPGCACSPSTDLLVSQLVSQLQLLLWLPHIMLSSPTVQTRSAVSPTLHHHNPYYTGASPACILLDPQPSSTRGTG